MLEASALGEPGRDRMRNPSGLAPPLDMGIARATIKERRRGVANPTPIIEQKCGQVSELVEDGRRGG